MQASGPVPLNIDVLNPKSMCFDRLSRTTTVPSFKSFLSGVLFYRANVDTHTHCDKVTAISAPLYWIISADNDAQCNARH